LWEAYEGGQVAHLHCPWTLPNLVDALRAGLLAAGYCLPPKGVVAFEPDFLTWNGGIIPKLACSISEERAFHFLPILGDALEEAGCTNVDALNHCRHPGEHLRGCWVLDRLLAPLPPDSLFDVIAGSRFPTLSLLFPGGLRSSTDQPIAGQEGRDGDAGQSAQV
jgi:hypothetical protein